MVIDLHVHLVGMHRPSTGCFVSERMRRSWTLWGLRRWWGLQRTPDPEAMDRRAAQMVIDFAEAARAVDAVVLFAMDGVYDPSGRLDEAKTSVYVPNDYLFEVVARSPRLLPGVSIHPGRRDALEELDRAVERGAALVKWVPPSQGIDPSDPVYTPFYRRMARAGLPLLSHTGYEHTLEVSDQKLGDPALLRLPLEEGVTVIAGHAGTSGRLHPVEYEGRFLALTRRYPNLYGDDAAFVGLSRDRYLRGALRAPERFERWVHGSDFPIPCFPWLFPFRLGARGVASLLRVGNPFDRDVLTKRALGVPEAVFTRGAGLLRPAGGGGVSPKGLRAPPPSSKKRESGGSP